jgi:Holliday junction resolvase
MVNSKLKGNRGERMFAAYLRERGHEARRGQQYQGGDDSPDVVHSIDGIHFEVKFVEKIQILTAVQQAKDDAAEGEIPVVAFKRKHREWIAILPMENLMTLIATK